MYIIPMATLSIGGRYFAMMLLPFASGEDCLESPLREADGCPSVGPQILMYKSVNLHIARPIAKRAAAPALMNAIGGTSNIWMSYTFYAPPHYFAAFGTSKSLCPLIPYHKS